MLSDEIRPHAVCEAIVEFLHEKADTAGKKHLIELLKKHGQDVEEPKAKKDDKAE